MRCSTYRNKSTIKACRARLSHDRASSMSPRSIRMDLGQKRLNVHGKNALDFQVVDAMHSFHDLNVTKSAVKILNFTGPLTRASQ